MSENNPHQEEPRCRDCYFAERHFGSYYTCVRYDLRGASCRVERLPSYAVLPYHCGTPEGPRFFVRRPSWWLRLRYRRWKALRPFINAANHYAMPGAFSTYGPASQAKLPTFQL